MDKKWTSKNPVITWGFGVSSTLPTFFLFKIILIKNIKKLIKSMKIKRIGKMVGKMDGYNF